MRCWIIILLVSGDTMAVMFTAFHITTPKFNSNTSSVSVTQILLICGHIYRTNEQPVDSTGFKVTNNEINRYDPYTRISIISILGYH